MSDSANVPHTPNTGGWDGNVDEKVRRAITTVAQAARDHQPVNIYQSARTFAGAAHTLVRASLVPYYPCDSRYGFPDNLHPHAYAAEAGMMIGVLVLREAAAEAFHLDDAVQVGMRPQLDAMRRAKLDDPGNVSARDLEDVLANMNGLPQHIAKDQDYMELADYSRYMRTPRLPIEEGIFSNSLGFVVSVAHTALLTSQIAASNKGQ